MAIDVHKALARNGLKKTGDALIPAPNGALGTITLLRNPTLALEAVPKQYVDAAIAAIPPSTSPSVVAWQYYQWVGANDATRFSGGLPPINGTVGFEGWAGGISSGTGTFAGNTIFAYPWLIARTTTFDTWYVQNTNNVAGAKARMGVYKNTGSATGVRFPGALVADINEWNLNQAAGCYSISQTVTLTGPDLFWFVYFTNSGTTSIKNISGGFLGNTITTGGGGAISQLNGMSVTATYGALPDPFPNGATGFNIGIPYLGYHVSAQG
jgi:hypothetical protein